MKNLYTHFATLLLMMIAPIMNINAQTYNHLGAWYYGTTFQATEHGYLDGFSVYTNAPNPTSVDVWLYGPFNDAQDCANIINGSGSAALDGASNLKNHQTIGTSGFTYVTDAPPSYDPTVYGLNYVQADPDVKVTVSGGLEGMNVKKNKYYLLFFSVANSVATGNDYRLTRVVDGAQKSQDEIDEENDYLIRASAKTAIDPTDYISGPNKMLICHTPPGNPNIQKTLEISVNAWPAHQAKGDVAGACPSTSYTDNTNELYSTFYLATSSPYQQGVPVPLDVTVNIQYDNKWRGNGSRNWSDKNNWSRKSVPVFANTVIVEQGYGVPLIDTTLTVDVLVVDSGATLEVADAADLEISDYLLNTGSIDGRVELNGSYDQIAAEGEVSTLEVNNTEGAILSGDMIISDELVLTDGTLDLDANTLTLTSDDESTGSIIPGGGDIVGDVTIQRYIPEDNGHHYLSSPIQGVSVDQYSDDWNVNLNASFPYLYYYDESTTSWVTPSSTSESLPVGVGYTGWISAGVTVDITGVVNEGPTPINVTNGGTSESGWNFIGNPYPSSIDWDLVTIPTEMSGAVYVWNHDQNAFGSYATYFDGISTNGGSDVIPHMQGFFVYTTEDATVTFQDDDRVSNTGTFLRTNKSGIDPMIRLELSGEGNAVETVLRFKADASVDYLNSEDALYFPAGNEDGAEFSSETVDGRRLVVNSLPEGSSDIVTKLNTKIGQNGVYTIDMTEQMNFSDDIEVILIDLKLDVTHDLSVGEYTFVGNVNDDPNRFELSILSNALSVSESFMQDQQQMFGYSSGDALMVRFARPLSNETEVMVYNALGQTVYRTNFQKGEELYSIPLASIHGSTVYLVEVVGVNDVLKICTVE